MRVIDKEGKVNRMLEMWLLEDKSASAIAAELGVTQQTIYNWMNEDDIRRTIREFQRGRLEEGFSRIIRRADEAMEVIYDMMHNASTPQSLKLQAARYLSDLRFRVEQSTSFEDRVRDALRGMLDEARKGD